MPPVQSGATPTFRPTGVIRSGDQAEHCAIPSGLRLLINRPGFTPTTAFGIARIGPYRASLDSAEASMIRVSYAIDAIKR